METESSPAEPEAGGHADVSLADTDDAALDAIARGEPIPAEAPDDEESDDGSEPEAETDEGEPLEDPGTEPESTPEEPKFATREEVQKLADQLKQQGGKLEGQGVLIQRRASEIAGIKQQLKGFIRDAQATLQEGEPHEQAKKVLQIEKAENQIAQIEDEESQLANLHANTEAVRLLVKPQEWDVDAMLLALSDDAQEAGEQLSPQYVAAFKQNPYSLGTPDGLVHLAKRSFTRKIAVQLATALKAATDELKDLREKVAKQTQPVTPDKVMRGVSRALSKPIPLTGRTGGAKSKVKVATTPTGDPSTWSPEELEAYLKAG